MIPAKTIVTYNTYAIHMDPDLWEDPDEFRPERFMDEEGNMVKPEAFVPFGMGIFSFSSFYYLILYLSRNKLINLLSKRLPMIYRPK